MSRMLQALKNLEKRSPWPAAASSAAAVPVAFLPEPEPVRETFALPPVEEQNTPLWEPEPPFAVSAPSVAFEPLPSFLAVLTQDSHYMPVFVAESPPILPFPTSAPPVEKTAEPVPSPVTLVAQPAAAAVAQPAALPQTDPKLLRQASRLERAVSRTMADPIRSEPFRQLAERLAENAQEIAGKTLLLAGVGSLSDTHEVVLHAAAALASEKARVLVIDGDLCRRSLADQLALADQRGLGDVLRCDCPLKEAITTTTLDHVSVLTAGRAGLILTSTIADKLPELFAELAEEYLYILIDGGRTDDPGASLLARLVDAAYFVVRLGATDAAEAQAALRTFRTASARVLGCIATS